MSFPTQAQTLEWVRDRWPDATDPKSRALEVIALGIYGVERPEWKGRRLAPEHRKADQFWLCKEKARDALAALRSAGFQVFRPEDCKAIDVVDDSGSTAPGTYFLVPADSGGSG